MPFYLRKALSFGPIRLNFSKHGVGVSGGVTGARVGMGPKGAYVHGGRHGLYYRKYASEGRGDRSSGQETQSRTDGEERYFVDTGVTYGSESGSNPQRKQPKAPELPGLEKPIAATVGSSILLVIGNFSSFGAIALLALAASLYWLYRAQKGQSRARKLLKDLRQDLENKEAPEQILQKFDQEELSDQAQQYVAFHFYRSFLQRFLEDPENISAEHLQELERKSSLPEQLLRAEKVFAFSAVLDQVMEDHVIDAEEEEQLRHLQEALSLNDSDISEEKRFIATMTAMRKAKEEELKPIDADVKLKEDEPCYFQSEGRFLKEKIQDRYQRERIVYKAIGYEIDMEGQLYLTDRRILIVGRGSRDYELKDVLDVTLSLQENILELTLDGRKNPVIVTTPDMAAFAGKLERLVGEG